MKHFPRICVKWKSLILVEEKNLHRKLKMFKTKIFYREFNLLFLPKILTRTFPREKFRKCIGSSLILLTESFKRKKETRIDKKNKRNVSFRPTEMIETRFPPNALPPTLPPSIVFETRARVALFNSCIIRSSRQIERIEASKAQLV